MDDVLDGADWLEVAVGYRPCDNVFSLKYLDYLKADWRDDEYYEKYLNKLNNLLIFNISDISNVDKKYTTKNFAIVRFTELYGGYVYRYCEI